MSLYIYSISIGKISLLIVLITCAACQKNEMSIIPKFRSNSSLKNIPDDIKNIADSKEITIAFTPQGDLDYGLTKLFCYSNGIWEKIEIRTDIVELDTIYSEKELGLIHKNVLLRQECRESEADSFLHKMIDNKLFELAEEGSLLEKCKSGTATITRYDAGAVVFQIIKGSQVRKLRYTYPWYRIKDCPNVTEWNNILAIKNLFEDEWYGKEH